MQHHFQGIAVAVLLAAGLYGVVWLLGASKRFQIRHHRQEMARYFERRNEVLLEARWKPFGPGAQADRSMLFEVRYRDTVGQEHRARCKTGADGVYLSDDEIVGD